MGGRLQYKVGLAYLLWTVLIAALSFSLRSSQAPAREFKVSNIPIDTSR
jgi:hypothetical protein